MDLLAQKPSLKRINDVLLNTIERHNFLRFAVQRHCQENVLFLIFMFDLPDEDQAISEKTFLYVVETFFLPNSEWELNLPIKIKKNILETYKQVQSKNTGIQISLLGFGGYNSSFGNSFSGRFFAEKKSEKENADDAHTKNAIVMNSNVLVLKSNSPNNNEIRNLFADKNNQKSQTSTSTNTGLISSSNNSDSNNDINNNNYKNGNGNGNGNGNSTVPDDDVEGVDVANSNNYDDNNNKTSNNNNTEEAEFFFSKTIFQPAIDEITELVQLNLFNFHIENEYQRTNSHRSLFLLDYNVDTVGEVTHDITNSLPPLSLVSSTSFDCA
eukprot:Awhi_evm1s14807